MKTYQLFASETGIFCGTTVSNLGDAPQDEPGFSWWVGDDDTAMKRVDVATNTLVDYTPPGPTTAQIAARVKQAREVLLAACDWTQLPDVPEATRAAWLTYRQALRDITTQAGYPDSITWPDAPTQ